MIVVLNEMWPLVFVHSNETRDEHVTIATDIYKYKYRDSIQFLVVQRAGTLREKETKKP